MSPVVFLLLPLVLSAVGCVLVTLLMSSSPSWPFRSTQSDIDRFKHRMDVLARGAHEASTSPIPAVVRADPPRLPQGRIRIGED